MLINSKVSAKGAAGLEPARNTISDTDYGGYKVNG